jgi:hypothetical protein
MKQASILFIIIFGLVTSCYKVYEPLVDRAQKVLVVDGMITNKTEAYHILLSYANAFNSMKPGLPVNAANVYVTDNLENRYMFHERESGNYISDSLQFTGQPGHTYRLHILTTDGTEYESDPQRMFPEVSPDNAYAKFDNQVILNGVTGLKVSTHGASIFMDIRNQSDTVPRFRIVSNLVLQYYNQGNFQLDWDHFLLLQYYCWQTVNINSNFNITDEDYLSNSASIKNHPAGFLDDNNNVIAIEYYSKINMDDTTSTAYSGNWHNTYIIHHRILYLSQYTLNRETYLYYKSLYGQIQSEGKLFDPVAAQLNGNIKCITDPEKKTIGFFEASSVSYSEYIVDLRNLVNSQPVLIKTPCILPPEPDGCQIDIPSSKHHNIPAFWISTGNT